MVADPHDLAYTCLHMPPQAKSKSAGVLERMQQDYPASLNNRLHNFASNIEVSTPYVKLWRYYARHDLSTCFPGK